MRIMFDSIDSMGIPADAEMVAGYIDGNWPSYGAMVNRFPAAIHVSIATNPAHSAQVLDCERGDATPEQCPGWVVARREADIEPTIYCSQSAWPIVRSEFAIAKVAEPMWWIANYNPSAPYPVGAVAFQHRNTALYDESLVPGPWPGVIPEPVPPILEEDFMRFYRKNSTGLIVISEGGHVTGIPPASWGTYRDMGFKLDNFIFTNPNDAWCGQSLDDGPFQSIVSVEGTADGEYADIEANFAAIEAAWKAVFVTPIQP